MFRSASRREPLTTRSASAPSWRTWLAWRGWRPVGVAVLVMLYCGLWNLVARLPLNPTDLDAFFVPATRIALAGHPFDVYSLRYLTTYPNANGPVSLAPLTLAVAIAQWQGWLANAVLYRVVVMTLFAPFVLLMAREGVGAVDRLRGRPLTGLGRFGAYALLALSPEIWHGMLFYGHIEQPIMLWLALLGLRQLQDRHPARAGVALGLALLARSSALLLILPLVALEVRGRDWRGIARLGAALVGTVVVVLLPFVIADGKDVAYSLLTFRARLPVAGGSLWGVALDTPLEAFGQRYDGVSVVWASLLLTGIVLLRRRDLTLKSPSLFLLLALSSFCFALLIKTLWPYYFLEPFTLLTIWWLGTMPAGAGQFHIWFRWGLALLLPCLAVACASIREYGLTLESTQRIFRSESIVLTAVMLLAMGLILWLLLARPDTRARDTASEPEPVAAEAG